MRGLASKAKRAGWSKSWKQLILIFIQNRKMNRLWKAQILRADWSFTKVLSIVSRNLPKGLSKSFISIPNRSFRTQNRPSWPNFDLWKAVLYLASNYSLKDEICIDPIELLHQLWSGISKIFRQKARRAEILNEIVFNVTDLFSAQKIKTELLKVLASKKWQNRKWPIFRCKISISFTIWTLVTVSNIFTPTQN